MRTSAIHGQAKSRTCSASAFNLASDTILICSSFITFLIAFSTTRARNCACCKYLLPSVSFGGTTFWPRPCTRTRMLRGTPAPRTVKTTSCSRARMSALSSSPRDSNPRSCVRSKQISLAGLLVMTRNEAESKRREVFLRTTCSVPKNVDRSGPRRLKLTREVAPMPVHNTSAPCNSNRPSVVPRQSRIGLPINSLARSTAPNSASATSILTFGLRIPMALKAICGNVMGPE